MVSALSVGLCVRRNHSTSIGAPSTVGWKPAPCAYRRMAAVGADHQIGADLLRLSLDRRAHAHHLAALLDQAGRLGVHQHREGRVALALGGEEIEEVPLRHHGDEGAAHRQVGEVGDLHTLLAELGAEARHFLVRQLQEFIEQAKLVHHVQRRGMDGVAAEVAQEVAVLLQHDGP